MKRHVDKQADALYLRLDDSKITDAQEVSPGVALDFNEHNQLVGIEMLNLISRAPTLILVSLLCLAQFVWTLVHEQVTGWLLVGALLAVLLMNAAFHALYRWGKGLHALTQEPL